MDIGVILKENNMKPINFVGPVKFVKTFEFAKRVYSFEADMQGNKKLELQALKTLSLPAIRRVTISNCRTNIAGEYI